MSLGSWSGSRQSVRRGRSRDGRSLSNAVHILVHRIDVVRRIRDVGLSGTIMPSPTGKTEAGVDIGTDAVTGAVQSYVVARAFGPVDVRMDATASFINADQIVSAWGSISDDAQVW